MQHLKSFHHEHLVLLHARNSCTCHGHCTSPAHCTDDVEALLRNKPLPCLLSCTMARHVEPIHGLLHAVAAMYRAKASKFLGPAMWTT